MPKPQFLAEYSPDVTRDCERVLVTLFSGLGPWRESVFLIGGLTPRYLVTARPPDVPSHAGTGDIDVVVDLAVLADTEAYRTLEENLKKMGFERAENDKGVTVNWRWRAKTEHGVTVILEFLADDPKLKGGALQELPTDGNISAINIPHASLVFELHDRMEVTADLLGEKGRATETIPYANIVSFTSLKAFAFDHRREGKDAHDLVYCLEHGDGGPDGAVAKFKKALAGKHGEVIRSALAILSKRFCDPNPDEGYLREGPVAVAQFELEGDNADAETREQRALRQREVNDVISKLLADLGA
ncbi:antitoxin (plasmid) [Mesorhizobium sp. AR07]|uniref:antitoxin n=1 Tax=Mesorhizobium sp. AR07 TaxID=2865838 RepID=UPI0021608AAC|nr:antitoxin [Mesorhizobium sp. AR07]UVK48933.1 antitoxin [Mesorhizobium sp. AR07]